MQIDVSTSGPIFDGRAPAIVERMARAGEDAIAAQAYATVMGNLNRSIRHPTPYYETQITSERLGGAAGRRVHDRGIVYGPWLEGTGSRNRTTRFKGYASFRRARQSVASRARAIADYAIARYIRELG